MKELNREKLEEYLSSLFDTKVQVISIEPIGKKEESDLKSFGYGRPFVIHFDDGKLQRRVVLETMSANHFGHEFASDRAGILLWSHSAYNSLPGHVRSLDVGSFLNSGEMISLGRSEELFLLTEYVEGTVYATDLQQLSLRKMHSQQDSDRVKGLADYLVRIHSVKRDEPALYARRIRELLGHGECIMGIVDNYPSGDQVATPTRLKMVEQLCLDWRWRIKTRSSRLCQVHGDFHPWNILFHNGAEFTVLDRSRGEWGEAADDVSSMMMNYIFQSVQTFARYQDPFESLNNLFWETYLNGRRDDAIKGVMQPFLAWRALVISNPVWYPTLKPEIREMLFRFIESVLQQDIFDPKNINKLLGVQ